MIVGPGACIAFSREGYKMSDINICGESVLSWQFQAQRMTSCVRFVPAPLCVFCQTSGEAQPTSVSGSLQLRTPAYQSGSSGSEGMLVKDFWGPSSPTRCLALPLAQRYQ